MLRASRTFVLASALSLAAAACRAPIEVRVRPAPNVSFGSLRTFRLLTATHAVGASAPQVAVDHAVAARLVRELEARGYVLGKRGADFGVLFDVQARTSTEGVTTGDPGDYPGWGRYGPPAPIPVVHRDGLVIVDLVRLPSRELLWRGEATAALSGDPREDVKRFARVAGAIVARLPRAAPAPPAVVATAP